MKKFYFLKIFCCVLSLVIMFGLPFFSFAKGSEPLPSVVTIKNPLGDNDMTPTKILEKIMDLVSILGTIIVVFFIIYSGFQYVMAGGDSGKITKAREMFLATVVGGAILLGASVIAKVVIETVNSIKP